MALKNRQPINSPAGVSAGGTPWVGLGILAVLVLILIAGASYLIFSGNDEPALPSTPATDTGQPEAPATTGTSSQAAGIPSSASRNTSRIPAGDPNEISLAALLAAHPVTGPGTPPIAVTIANSDQWQAAVAAASLAADPVGAPLLLAPSGVLDQAGRDVLAELDPAGSPVTRESQLFTIGTVSPPAGYRARKVTGTDPAAVAAEVADLRSRLAATAPGAILIASSEDEEFAPPAASWAARSGDPVLFTSPDSVPEPTLDFLKDKRNAKVPVFVLGSTEQVSADVVKRLSRVSPSVERISARTPVEMALEMVRYSSGSFGWNLNDPGHGYMVARADRPMDAVAAIPLTNGGTWPALLLTDDQSEPPEPLVEYLIDVKPGYTTDPTRALYNHIWIIGDEEVIDLNQQGLLDDAAELAKVETAD